MNGPEQHNGEEYKTAEAKIAIRYIAEQLTGKKYPPSGKGTRNALAVLEQQHAKLLPPGVSEMRQIAALVAEDHMLIALAATNVVLGLNENDYELTLSAANHLYFYGEADFQNDLGGRTLELSLQMHLELMEHVTGRFSTSDSYLLVHFGRILPDIQTARAQGQTHQELDLVRGVVHTVALNGTLGEAASKRLDPFALVLKKSL